MNCKEIKEKIYLLDDADISAKEKEEIKAHINKCGECRQVYENLQKISAAFFQKDVLNYTEIFAGKVMSEISKRERKTFSAFLNRIMQKSFLRLPAKKLLALKLVPVYAVVLIFIGFMSSNLITNKSVNVAKLCAKAQDLRGQEEMETSVLFISNEALERGISADDIVTTSKVRKTTKKGVERTEYKTDSASYAVESREISIDDIFQTVSI